MLQIKWDEKALVELSKLEKSVSSRIYKKVESLKEGFKSADIKKIKGSNDYRLRVGDYRVIFTLEASIMVIWKIGHRKNIYS